MSEFSGKLILEMGGGFAVKRKRFSVEQIVAVLKQAELGMPVGADAPGWNLGADVLSVEEAVRGAAVGPGPGVEAIAGGECTTEEAGR